MWKEGMFLRPHHFQQQDGWAESALAARMAAAIPFHWGFSRLTIDEGRLEAGQIALLKAAGALRDGTPFVLAEDTTDAPPLTPPQDARDVVVRLVVPTVSPGTALGSNDAPGRVNSARYAIRPHDRRDLLREGEATAPVELGSLNLSLALGAAPAGFDSLPVARILEVAQGRVKLDPDFIPPVLHVTASPRLAHAVSELAARFDARAAQLAGPSGVAGGMSAGANRQLMLLRICNAKAALLNHRERVGCLVHPETLYAEFVETAAELLTFTDRDARRPPPAPTYDHDDLAACFLPLIQTIQLGLGRLEDPEAREIPLEFHARQRVYFNRSIDPAVLERARVFLVARASMADEEFRAALPRNISIGSTAGILDIIQAATYGAPIRPMPHFPQELRPQSGWVCFEVDQNNSAWEGVRAQRTVAIHTQDALQDLRLQLWAVQD
jgi:type VI secretion system protein ImpJ